MHVVLCMRCRVRGNQCPCEKLCGVTHVAFLRHREDLVLAALAAASRKAAASHALLARPRFPSQNIGIVHIVCSVAKAQRNDAISEATVEICQLPLIVGEPGSASIRSTRQCQRLAQVADSPVRAHLASLLAIASACLSAKAAAGARASLSHPSRGGVLSESSGVVVPSKAACLVSGARPSQSFCVASSTTEAEHDPTAHTVKEGMGQAMQKRL